MPLQLDIQRRRERQGLSMKYLYKIRFLLDSLTVGEFTVDTLSAAITRNIEAEESKKRKRRAPAPAPATIESLSSAITENIEKAYSKKHTRAPASASAPTPENFVLPDRAPASAGVRTYVPAPAPAPVDLVAARQAKQSTRSQLILCVKK